MQPSYYLLAPSPAIWKEFAHSKGVSLREVNLLSRDADRLVDQLRGYSGITLHKHVDWMYNLESSMIVQMNRNIQMLQELGTIKEVVVIE